MLSYDKFRPEGELIAPDLDYDLPSTPAEDDVPAAQGTLLPGDPQDRP